MSIETFKLLIGETSYTDEQLMVLLERAKRMAINHYWWKEDDIPTNEEVENFIERYEFEIYDLAKTVIESAQRGGLKQFSELGVTRVWQTTGSKDIEDSLKPRPD